jgi:ABC-2 type transport system ATP-binding protein
MLEEFRSRGATIVFSTSYMDEAERCDGVAFLDRGRMVALGAPTELRAKADGLVYRVVSRNPLAVDALLRDHGDVIGIQWQANAVRFIVNAPGVLAPQLRQDLERIGKVQSAPASIEDAYVILRGVDTTTQPEARIVRPIRAPGTERVAIETQALTRRFDRFTAVGNVTFAVEPGEIFGLLGANGAGKTTLIRMLCGLLPPTCGNARVAGFDAGAAPRLLRQHIGYMSQRFSLYPDLTVAENLAFFASAYGMANPETKAAIRWASDAVGLDITRDDLVADLSGALRQRLALACSILHRPAVLFLDEPTSGVDPLSRFRFWRLVRDLAVSGTAIVITTHYLEEAVYCQRLGFMHHGRLIAVGNLPSLHAALPSGVPEAVEDVFITYITREQEQQPLRSAE